MESEPQITEPSPVSKPKNKLTLPLILVSILALAGLGLGIYGFFFKKSEAPAQNTDTSSLESELSSLKQKYSVLQDYVKELEASGTEVSEEVKSATATETTTVANTAEYIYIGSWGLKIKKPSELIYLEYKLTSYSDMQSLCLTGARAIDKNLTSSDGPFKLDKMIMGCIYRGPSSRTSSGYWVGDPEQATFAIGDFSFWYEGPQAIFTEENAEAEIKNVGLIREMLSNSSNYSAI